MPKQRGLKHGELTNRQLAFIEAYDGDATATAARIGMSKSYALKLMMRPAVRAAIAKRDDGKPSKHVLARIDRQRYWTRVILDENESTAMRLRASELLGKSEGDFLIRHEISDRGALLDVLFNHAENNAREFERTFGASSPEGADK